MLIQVSMFIQCLLQMESLKDMWLKKDKKHEQRNLTLIMENKPGALARVVGSFSSKRLQH